MKSKEGKVEQYLTMRANALGGICVKLPGQGMPDRLAIMPDGLVIFVECKAKDGIVSALQHEVGRRLQERGHKYRVVRTPADVDAIFGGNNAKGE